jgi:hypothetical protein
MLGQTESRDRPDGQQAAEQVGHRQRPRPSRCAGCPMWRGVGAEE